jgi:hypothetical protein
VVPHCITSLQTLKSWNRGLGIVLTPTGVSLCEATAANIIDETEFSVVLPMTPLLSDTLQEQMKHKRVSMQCGPICGPSHARAIINVAARDMQCDMRVQPITPAAPRLVVTGGRVDGASGLGTALGFGHGGTTEASAGGYAGFAQLPCGSYPAQELASAVESTTRLLVPVSKAGAGGLILIGNGEGKYVPVPLISSCGYSFEMLSHLLSAIARTNLDINNIHVELTDDNHVRFRSDRQVFGLSFEQKECVKSSMFGFAHSVYEGSNEYVSESPIHVPVLGCAAAPRHPRRRYSLQLSAPTQQAAVESRAIRLAMAEGITRSELLPDLRAGDLCHLTGTGLVHVSRGYPRLQLMRTEQGAVASCLKLKFDETDDTPSGIVTVAPDLTFVLHHEAGVGEHRLKPRILGFQSAIYETNGVHIDPLPVRCNPAPLYVRAPNCVDFDPPAYVLVCLESPNVNASSSHRAILEDGRVIHPFAKVCFVPYRVERINPAELRIPEGDSVGVINICLLNPDGTPYHTHGKQFSLSIATTAMFA